MAAEGQAEASLAGTPSSPLGARGSNPTASPVASSQPLDVQAAPAASVAAVLPRQSVPEAELHQWLLPLISHAFRSRLALAEAAVRDPWRDVRKQLGRLVSDLALTREQQEVLERVVTCNVRFWEVSVNGGGGEDAPAWGRHLGLNIALLRVYHCHVAAAACIEALTSATSPPAMTKTDAEDALHYCRWMAASYSCRWGALPPRLTEADLAKRAAAVAGAAPTAVFASALCDVSQPSDPLCPRFLIALDEARNEVILSVRGTASLSDLFADLIGDTVPFAGGVAHAGICDAARRLRARAVCALRAALERLDTERGRRLVLTGHSLGAGVAELLAILLRGGDADRIGGVEQWCLPTDIKLATYLYAPAPVYGPDPTTGDCRGVDGAAVAHARKAAESAMSCAIGFAMNYDIVPRTSLHNGYKLFQQVRVVDNYVRWSQREAVCALQEATHTSPERAACGRACVVAAVEAAIAEAVASTPAPANPFALQHPAVARMHHIVGAPGGTAASLANMAASEGPDSGDAGGLCSRTCPTWGWRRRGSARGPPRPPAPASAPLAALEVPGVTQAGVGACSHRGWIYKRSRVLGEWRRRFAWVEGGELRIAHGADGAEAKTVMPLTAGATVLHLLGPPSTKSFPATIVVTNGEDAGAADEEAGGAGSSDPSEATSSPQADGEGSSHSGSAGQEGRLPRRALRRPTPWAFKVETAAVGGACPVDADSVVFCAATAAERDAWASALADAVRAARRECYRMKPAVPPEAFGREALLADGCVDDHQVLRYEAALEALVESCSDVGGSGTGA